MPLGGLEVEALQADLPRDLLKGHPVLGQQFWDTQVSGTAIKTAVLAELENFWQSI